MSSVPHRQDRRRGSGPLLECARECARRLEVTNYPAELQPVSDETFALPNGDVLRVPKARPRFRRWCGSIPFSLGPTLRNKDMLDAKGEPVFAELATLRLLETAGWQGVWVDSFHRCCRVAPDRSITLPAERAALLEQIENRVGKRGGCFDVYAWRDGSVLFAELKLSGKDTIRESQCRWLAGALACGLPIDSFLVVEWTLE
jgi:hypothetical protein